MEVLQTKATKFHDSAAPGPTGTSARRNTDTYMPVTNTDAQVITTEKARQREVVIPAVMP